MSLDEMQARCDAAKYKPHSITFTDRVSCGAVNCMSAAIVDDERGTPMFIVPRQAGTSDDMLLQMLSRVVQNEADMPRLIAALRVAMQTIRDYVAETGVDTTALKAIDDILEGK